jgi:hypothetical protein
VRLLAADEADDIGADDRGGSATLGQPELLVVAVSTFFGPTT